MKGIWSRLLEWWDWKIYHFGWKTMNRMCERNQGFAYLFKLQIDDWLERNPLSPELMNATEKFHEALKTWPKEKP